MVGDVSNVVKRVTCLENVLMEVCGFNKLKIDCQ